MGANSDQSAVFPIFLFFDATHWQVPICEFNRGPSCRSLVLLFQNLFADVNRKNLHLDSHFCVFGFGCNYRKKLARGFLKKLKYQMPNDVEYGRVCPGNFSGIDSETQEDQNTPKEPCRNFIPFSGPGAQIN